MSCTHGVILAVQVFIFQLNLHQPIVFSKGQENNLPFSLFLKIVLFCEQFLKNFIVNWEEWFFLNFRAFEVILIAGAVQESGSKETKYEFVFKLCFRE